MTRLQVPSNALTDIRTVESRTSRLERVNSQLVLKNINTVSAGSPLSDSAIDRLVFTNNSPIADPNIGVQPTDGLLIEDATNGFQLIRQSGHWVRFASSYKPWGIVSGVGGGQTYPAGSTPITWDATNNHVGNGMVGVGEWFVVPTAGLYEVHSDLAIVPFTPIASGFMQILIDYSVNSGSTWIELNYGGDVLTFNSGVNYQYPGVRTDTLIGLPAGALVRSTLLVSGSFGGNLTPNGGKLYVTKYSD